MASVRVRIDKAGLAWLIRHVPLFLLYTLFISPVNIPPPPTPSSPLTSTSSLARKIRLVPTSFENADAVVVVPPSLPNAPPPQPLLLVGPALARLRHPQRPLAKGARIHPYRITRPTDRHPPAGPVHTNA